MLEFHHREVSSLQDSGPRHGHAEALQPFLDHPPGTQGNYLSGEAGKAPRGSARIDMAMGQNLVLLVNIKIAGIYGCENPTNIDNNRF